MPEIGIILGSDSDLPKIEGCFALLDEFNIDFEIIISSAHRTPERTREWAMSAEERGIRVIIAAAGGAAHLPGVVSSHTTLPVIGIPVETDLAGGLDSILSILQMPSGFPVATMAAGKAGGINAGLYAASILALGNPDYKKKLADYRRKTAEKISAKNTELTKTGYAAYIKKIKG